MELLEKSQYQEYEDFVINHPNGSITQSVLWHGVKLNWLPEIAVVRNSTGKIIAGVSLLARKIPGLGTSMLYAPRGPVCDYDDKDALEALQQGINLAAKKHKAHLCKVDPDVLISDVDFANIIQTMGYKQLAGGTGFETIQARFNYRLYLNGRSEDELFANLTQQNRRNVRIAIKNGVQVRIMGAEALDDFMQLMVVTGQRDGFSVRPKAYFARMLEALGEHCRLYMAYYNDKAVSGAITTNYAGKTCYIYGASDNEHRNVMPNNLVQWEMIRWAAETGCTVYDFQGISGNLDENDPLYGLYRFKKGFNGQIDELAGEFDYTYMPVRTKLVDLAIDANERLRNLRRTLRG